MVKNRSWRAFLWGISLNLSFPFLSSFLFFNIFFCLVFLLLYVLICLCSLGLCFCMFKKQVRMLDLAFKVFAMFLRFLGRNSCTHNLACASRLDYAHTGLFMRAHEPTQKTLFLFCLFLLLFSHIILCLASFPCFYVF